MKNFDKPQQNDVSRTALGEPLVHTPKDIEQLLCLSKNSVNALLRSGQLRSIRYGRKWLIPRSALEEFLNGRREQP